jgi:hypothetical protein
MGDALRAEGFDTFASSAHAASRDLERLVAAAGDRAGTVVLDAVRPPIDTGTLAATVHVITTDQGFGIAAGGPSAPYVAIVHAKHPFITDALTARESAVVDTYADAVTDAVDSIKGA